MSTDKDIAQRILTSGAAPDPCFVLNEERLRGNVKILEEVQEKSGAKILLALKAFANWPVFPLLSREFAGPLWGTCASSVDEARLGREKFGGEVHAFAAAWSEAEIRELLAIADHIVFNSLRQWLTFRPLCLEANATKRKNSPLRFGLRLNPEHSEGAPAIYNPCSPQSRLGIRLRDLDKASAADLAGLSGYHFHTLCEQGAEELQRTLQALRKSFQPWLQTAQWLNFGGGHHITKAGYNIDLLVSLVRNWGKKAQIYLEPGEAVALNAGWLTATVLDIVEADMPVAILNVSAACHMPDVLEMPYTPDFWTLKNNEPIKAQKPGKEQITFRLAGASCLAGDMIGEYSLPAPLQIGDRLAFTDMAIYSMVKTNTFNGLRLPAIGIMKAAGFTLLREFGYSDFMTRLG